jgi:hypothetical protein
MHGMPTGSSSGAKREAGTNLGRLPNVTIPDIEDVTPVEPFKLKVTFSSGDCRVVDIRAMRGTHPMFAPLCLKVQLSEREVKRSGGFDGALPPLTRDRFTGVSLTVTIPCNNVDNCSNVYISGCAVPLTASKPPNRNPSILARFAASRANCGKTVGPRPCRVERVLVPGIRRSARPPQSSLPSTNCVRSLTVINTRGSERGGNHAPGSVECVE